MDTESRKAEENDGGGFLGLLLSILYKHGEERKVKQAILILICLLIILNVHYLLEGGMGPGWGWVLSISTIVGCIAIGYFTMSSLIKRRKIREKNRRGFDKYLWKMDEIVKTELWRSFGVFLLAFLFTGIVTTRFEIGGTFFTVMGIPILITIAHFFLKVYVFPGEPF